MALENCKECGAQISSKAKQCPSCGAPIKRTSFLTKLAAIFIAFIVIIAVMGGRESSKRAEESRQHEAQRVASLTPEQRAAEEAKKAEAAAKQAARDLEISAVGACRIAIPKMLKDPDSAKFEYTSNEAPVEVGKNGIYKVQHKVRAKNSFGAYTLSYFNCTLKHDPAKKQWSVLDIKEFN